MACSPDKPKRWRGVLCLSLAGAMLILGQTVLEPSLRGMAFLFYWFLCFLLTIAALVLAMLDIRSVRNRARQEHRALIEKTLQDLPQNEPKDRP